ncbi:metallophosphoesterase family protein [Corticimicrobacter populi]|uniref:DNA repair exonuclease n=1 Tax=Corticimicrobacter populi TaxID=2175229 RepID=A0A2V1JVY9_9BURK|nr:DNA repair exonuclease [Corticimicrobacter populi]PWF22507.1 DNA repair exonuclease [Corticimicrobacter populi]
MTRILHTADWQIGRQYARFEPEDAAALSEARFRTVERIAALAQSGGYDAVLVAGDVFDAQTVSERTLRRLFNALQGFDGDWVLLPGNHDAALVESVWTQAQRLGLPGPRMHLALRPEVILLEASSLAILPAPLTQRQTYEDLTTWFDQAGTPTGWHRIGLAHGSVQGILQDDIDAPNPIAPDRAARARLDYLALGDWHGQRCIDAHTWYSGTPEPDRFKDNGAGHVLSVAWDDGASATASVAPTVEPLFVAHHVWQQWHDTLAVPDDLDRLVARLEAAPAQAVLDLTLEGRTDLAGQHRLQEALARAQALLRSLSVQQDGLKLYPGEQELAALSASGYVGEVIAELQARQESDDSGTSREALVILAQWLEEA